MDNNELTDYIIDGILDLSLKKHRMLDTKIYDPNFYNNKEVYKEYNIIGILYLVFLLDENTSYTSHDKTKYKKFIFKNEKFNNIFNNNGDYLSIVKNLLLSSNPIKEEFKINLFILDETFNDNKIWRYIVNNTDKILALDVKNVSENIERLFISSTKLLGEHDTNRLNKFNNLILKNLINTDKINYVKRIIIENKKDIKSSYLSNGKKSLYIIKNIIKLLIMKKYCTNIYDIEFIDEELKEHIHLIYINKYFKAIFSDPNTTDSYFKITSINAFNELSTLLVGDSYICNEFFQLSINEFNKMELDKLKRIMKELSTQLNKNNLELFANNITKVINDDTSKGKIKLFMNMTIELYL